MVREPFRDDRMILLDLAGDIKEIWRLQPAFRKKPYIWNLLHNFGGRTRLQGDLSMVASKPLKALNDPNHGNMAGMGLTMEGIQQNAVVYELMCDTMWRTTPVDLNEWIHDYALQRYGRDAKDAFEHRIGAYVAHKHALRVKGLEQFPGIARRPHQEKIRAGQNRSR